MSNTTNTTRRSGRKATTPAPATPAATTPAPAPRAAQKLRWQFPAGFAARFDTGQLATLNGNSYALLPVEGQPGVYSATHAGPTGEVTTLVEAGTHAKCYARLVAHHNANYIAPVDASATPAA
jgi:hypothetical protein